MSEIRIILLYNSNKQIYIIFLDHYSTRETDIWNLCINNYI